MSGRLAALEEAMVVSTLANETLIIEEPFKFEDVVDILMSAGYLYRKDYLNYLDKHIAVRVERPFIYKGRMYKSCHVYIIDKGEYTWR